MTAVPFSTSYLRGIDYLCPFDMRVWNMEPYERDNWGKEQLKQAQIEPKEVTHVNGRGFSWFGSIPEILVISTYDYTPAARK